MNNKVKQHDRFHVIIILQLIIKNISIEYFIYFLTKHIIHFTNTIINQNKFHNEEYSDIQIVINYNSIEIITISSSKYKREKEKENSGTTLGDLTKDKKQLLHAIWLKLHRLAASSLSWPTSNS